MIVRLEFPSRRADEEQAAAESDALVIRLADYRSCGHALKRRDAIRRAVKVALARAQHGGDAA